MKHWIVEHLDGSTTYHVTNGDDPEAEGVNPGERHACTGRARLPNELWSWADGQWLVDAKLDQRWTEDKMIPWEEARRERAAVFVNRDKHLVYALKASEVRRWAGDASNARADFPFAYYDAQAKGDAVADAIARFRSGIARSVPLLAKLEAEFQACNSGCRVEEGVEFVVPAGRDPALVTESGLMLTTEAGDALL